MKWFRNLKFQNKLYLAFGILVLLLVILSIFSCWQFYDTDKKYGTLITSTYGHRNSVSRATADMNKLLLVNLAKGSQITTSAYADDITVLVEQHEQYVESIRMDLSEYRDHVSTDAMLSDENKAKLLKILDKVWHRFTNEYLPKTKELDGVLYSDRQEKHQTLEEALDIGSQVSTELETFYQTVALVAEETAAATTIHSRRVITFILTVNLFFVLLAMVAVVLMVRAIKAPITEIEHAMSEISHGNLFYPIQSSNDDELGRIANQIGDMVGNLVEMNKVVTIMDNLESMIGVIDLDYNFVYVNQSFAKMGKLDINDYRGKKCYKALRNLDHPCSFCRMHSLLPKKDFYPFVNYEFVFDEAFGVWTGGKAAIIDWVDGSKVYLQSIHDESKLKESQERLEEAMVQSRAANEAKSQFLANMSHEIRTPMNAVLGMAELLLLENLNERQLRYVKDINVSAIALLTIIDDILDVSKIQAGKLNLVPVHYDFSMLIDNVGAVVQFLIENKKNEGKNITFWLMMPEHPHLCLFGDDVRLRQVLLNLLSNAVKFTNEGYVHLIIDFTKTTVKMTVSDTGVGIPPENIPTIFDAFEQADVQKNRGIKGAGLGLTITRSIVETMGGRITVESVYGQGTSFHVEIPMVLGNATLIQNTGSKADLVCAPDAKILVVDDNETNLHVASGLLRVCQITPAIATSGKQAIEMVRHNSYDLVFMDHRMPGMSGIETTKAIRGLGIPVPIVALTASVVTDARKRMLDAGMNDYLSKPIIKVELMNMLRKWLPAGKLVEMPSQVIATGNPDDEAHRKFWVKIEQIEALDLATGLNRVYNQRGVYEKTLRLMVREIEKSNRNLVAFLSTSDMENFCIEVHGIKSVLANAGATGLSKKAYALERASDQKDIGFCTSNLSGFLEGLNNLYLGLTEAFTILRQGDDLITIPSELRGIFEKLIYALDKKDWALIDREIENLNALNLKGWLKEETEQIEDAVLMMDYAEAIEHIEQLLSGA